MLFFNYAQTFYLDSSAVKGASEVAITKIDLYFRAKPPAEGNKSGIYKPGVEVMILPTDTGLPVIDQIGAYRPTEPTEHGAKFAFYSGGQVARVEWDQITPSTDGSVPVEFLLNSPAFVKTNREYAIVIKYDGNENFVLWKSVEGDDLVGTSTPSPGTSGTFRGSLFTYIDNPAGGATESIANSSAYGYTNNSVDSATANNTSLIQTSTKRLGIYVWDQAYLNTNWTPNPGENLKFKLYVARYAIDGQPTALNTSYYGNTLFRSADDREFLSSGNTNILSNNVIRLTAQIRPQEYIKYSRKNSTKREVSYGEPIYQDIPNYSGNTITAMTVNCAANLVGSNTEYTGRLVTANGSFVLANGTTFNASGGWDSLVFPGEGLIFTSANGELTEIKLVQEIVSNTQILMDSAFEETMNLATFKIAPFAYVSEMGEAYIFGKSDDLLVLYDPYVSENTRFTGNSVSNIAISNTGTGYSNSDYVRIGGFEDIDYGVKGGMYAYANIGTDASGNITTVYITNSGAWFSNSTLVAGSNVEILQSANGVASNTASAGSGANLTITIGTNLKSAFTNTTFANCDLVNVPIHRMKPEITVNNPLGAAFTINHKTLYYGIQDSNTISGYSYYINTPDEQNLTAVPSKIFKGHDMVTQRPRFPVMPSRSNEVVLRFANGAVSNLDVYGIGLSNAALLQFDISSNNDYQAVYVDPEIVQSHYASYICNRNYTNEHTNFGDAWAKHVATKINFKEDRLAEDSIVYVTGFRPANTDILCYVKLHNSADTEEFDDKEWTQLDLIDGIGVYSSQDDTTDFKEFTFSLPDSPNTEITLDGTATVYQGNAEITGTNTVFGAQFIINSGGSGYTNGDIVYATSPTKVAPASGIYALQPSANASGTVTTDGSGVITAITVTNGGKGWESTNTITSFSVSNSTGGSTGGSTANIHFIPGLYNSDLIKIYSPLFANTNYAIAVVNSVTSNTSMTVKRIFGDLSANMVGTVAVNATANVVTGTSTSFATDYTVGDYIAVWANSNFYEVRQVTAVTNSTFLETNSNWTIPTASGLNYAYVTSSTFVNNSISLDGLKVDRLAFKHQAFKDPQNSKVAKYYDTQMVPFDGYDTFQVKMVMLSENKTDVPKIDDVRGLGTTA